jgi:hypothetical protein
MPQYLTKVEDRPHLGHLGNPFGRSSAKNLVGDDHVRIQTSVSRRGAGTAQCRSNPACDRQAERSNRSRLAIFVTVALDIRHRHKPCDMGIDCVADPCGHWLGVSGVYLRRRRISSRYDCALRFQENSAARFRPSAAIVARSPSFPAKPIIASRQRSP